LKWDAAPLFCDERNVKLQQYCPSGFDAVPVLAWGSHLSQIYKSGDDLRDVLVPYFKAGLENNESCLWVTGAPFGANQARSALRAAVPDFDKREKRMQIEIRDAQEWYASGEKLRPHDLVNGLLRRQQQAVDQGYQGLRTGGNCGWVDAHQWPQFQEYESLMQKASRGRRMICLCSYCMDQLRDGSHLDVIERHDMALPGTILNPPRHTNGIAADAIDSVRDVMDARELRLAFERQKRTFDLAMIASDMGTWRYTLADNVCIYDKNAQRLYGLSEASFLHDEDGVNAKFHCEDLDLMWSRVAEALDPNGDGRYNVEYRVRQQDGSWRWLSAWGLVEFEGDGAERKAVAIAGASRDLTERKQAEERQRLLLNELNHRVKNTLATVQAVAWQTLRTARDLPSASEALDRRILAMAQAHDLLTSRNWTGASVSDIVTRALQAFPPGRVTVSGAGVDLSPRHALALSLVLHELGTNATKYGSLSNSEGRVSVRWGVQDGRLQLFWEESGGPAVTPPTKTGFGSRMIEQLVVSELGGDLKLDYAPSGLRCQMTATV
jgi:two-component sensor histidine kinase/PAS domain-containing protein